MSAVAKVCFLILAINLFTAPTSSLADSAQTGTWAHEVERLHKQAQELFDSGNYRTATATYKRLAFFGDRYAMYRIAHVYEAGLGVEQNPAEAWAWAQLSAETKVPQFEANQSRVWSTLSEAEKVLAKERWKALHTYYSELAVAHRVVTITDRKIRNVTGSRTGEGNQNLIVYLGDYNWVRGENYIRELKQFSSNLKDHIGQMGTVEVRDESAPHSAETPNDASAQPHPKDSNEKQTY